ncbi:hypothetical protein Bxe_C1208 [Paraburkholderia xenovorans LB400]|uniref:Uncharacterized protein n=1 Tax=Paraburkholderia xenovorans (strain LB400) TaxID=266265 RepID=Q13FS1_PARXL|nr:hypothetical protein Bxe_C1208 [Paraburkholderia xenovorans LB400]
MSARGAVRLSGVAPCFVPNHGHAASILHATAALIADPGLRAALANTGCAWVARCGGLLLLHRATAFSPCKGGACSHSCGLRPSLTLDCLRCAVPRKGRAIPPGNLSGAHHEQRTHH